MMRKFKKGKCFPLYLGAGHMYKAHVLALIEGMVVYRYWSKSRKWVYSIVHPSMLEVKDGYSILSRPLKEQPTFVEITATTITGIVDINEEVSIHPERFEKRDGLICRKEYV